MTRVALVALLWTLPAQTVTAQEIEEEDAAAAEDDGDAARALFEEGVEAEQSGRLDIARDKFRASFEIEPRLNTAINLGVVLTRLGQLLEAEALLVGLDETHPDRSEDDTRQIDELLGLVRSEIASVDLQVAGEAEGEVDVRVDGARVTSVRPNASTNVRVDPGRRVFVALTGDGRTVEEALDVSRGEQLSLELTLPPRLVVDEEGEESSAWQSPWLWTGIVLAVAAAIVVPIVIVTMNNQPTTDPVWGRGEVD
jgi:hypothetical protein